MNFMKTNDLGVDLGTSNVLIYVDGKGIVVKEPTVVAMDRNEGRILQVGAAARNMMGRTPGNLVAMKPLTGGIISDHEMTVRMLSAMFRSAAKGGLLTAKPRVVITVPSGITEVEERNVINAAIEAGARRVFLIEEPLASALGAGKDLSGAKGHMVVDIGGGTTNIAVLSMNGVVLSSSLRIAGDFFDNDFDAIHSPEKAAQTLKGLQATHGVYVCPGNHDSGPTVPEMLRFWEECQIRLLADEFILIDGRLVLAGRLDPSPIGGFDGRKRTSIESLLAAAPKDLPVIVLDHNPANAATYGSGVSLVLCGHTHKGQIFPGSLFTHRMFDVDHGFWKKDSESPAVIVSSGVGTWGMPMRVGTDSEIVSVNLHFEKTF